MPRNHVMALALAVAAKAMTISVGFLMLGIVIGFWARGLAS